VNAEVAMAFEPGGDIVFAKPHQPADPDRRRTFVAGEQVIDGADMTLDLGCEVLFGLSIVMEQKTTNFGPILIS
jgi:hypothetical protein